MGPVCPIVPAKIRGGPARQKPHGDVQLGGVVSERSPDERPVRPRNPGTMVRTSLPLVRVNMAPWFDTGATSFLAALIFSR
jgi:hypothetical protein